MAPRRPQAASREPQELPKGPQDGPKRRQRGPRTMPRGAKTTPRGPKRRQDDPKMAPRRPQDGPKSPPSRFQVAFKKRIVSRGPPRHAQEAPNRPQDASKRPPRAPLGRLRRMAEALGVSLTELALAAWNLKCRRSLSCVVYLCPQIAEGGGGGHSPPGVLDNRISFRKYTKQ